MLKLFSIILIFINQICWTSEPISSQLTDQINKCIARELGIHSGKIAPSWKETWLGSGCYKWIDASRTSSTALTKQCHQDPEFSALLAKNYCTKQAKN